MGYADARTSSRGRRIAHVLVLALLAGCSAADPLYRPAERLYTGGPEPDCAGYIAATRAHREQHAVAVPGFDRRRPIDWRLPFERAPAPGCRRAAFACARSCCPATARARVAG